jgi:hypothetical protein
MRFFKRLSNIHPFSYTRLTKSFRHSPIVNTHSPSDPPVSVPSAPFPISTPSEKGCHQSGVSKTGEQNFLKPQNQSLTQPAKHDHKDEIHNYFTNCGSNVQGLNRGWSTSKHGDNGAEDGDAYEPYGPVVVVILIIITNLVLPC